MIEIGAGGGSIARIDALGLLKVGPDSAGADPGPACYGRGGDASRPSPTPTWSSATSIPASSSAAAMALDVEAAREAIRRDVAEPLGLSVEEAAWGIHQIVNESMAGAARVHTLERGDDPRRLPVFAFGGAGPVHGYRVAAALGSPRLIVPSGAGVMSAVGFLAAPLAFDFVRSFPGRLDALDWARVNGLFDRDGSRRHATCWRSAGVARARRSPTAAPPTCATSGRATRCACRCRRDRSPRPASRAARRRSRPSTVRLYGRLGPPVAGGSDHLARRLLRSAPRSAALDRAGGDGRRRGGAQGHAPGLLPGAGRDDRRRRSTTATGWARARRSPARPSSRSANRRPSSVPARRCRSMIEGNSDRRSGAMRME